MDENFNAEGNVNLWPCYALLSIADESDLLKSDLCAVKCTVLWILTNTYNYENTTKNQDVEQFRACVFSRVWLFTTPWTVARQAHPSMGFPRQEYWSGLPFPSLGIFSTQGSSLIFLDLLDCQADSLPLCRLASPEQFHHPQESPCSQALPYSSSYWWSDTCPYWVFFEV